MYCYFSYQGLSFVYFTSFNNAHARATERESACVYMRVTTIVPTHSSQKKHQASTRKNLCFYISVMILPQVHLRKPCYDFYFL